MGILFEIVRDTAKVLIIIFLCIFFFYLFARIGTLAYLHSVRQLTRRAPSRHTERTK